MTLSHFGSKSKQVIKASLLCCCTYRHPNTDVGKFTEHLESVVSKYDKSSKIVSIMGNFNINLLECEHHTDTNNFVNSMVSHYLLPYILHPTRVTDHSATVIDNIFSNVTDFETVSDNIFNQIADYYSQFLIITKLQVDYKSSTFYQYNYSK